MWQRFTERARYVIFYAQEEAGVLEDYEVSTEHILLGLLRDKNEATLVLQMMGGNPGRIRQEIKRRITRGNGRLGNEMKLTTLAKQAINFAYDEEERGGYDYLGTEHLLLGLLGVTEGLAAEVLSDQGITLDAARLKVLEVYGPPPVTWPPPPMLPIAPRQEALPTETGIDATALSETTPSSPKWLQAALKVLFRN